MGKNHTQIWVTTNNVWEHLGNKNIHRIYGEQKTYTDISNDQPCLGTYGEQKTYTDMINDQPCLGTYGEQKTYTDMSNDKPCLGTYGEQNMSGNIWGTKQYMDMKCLWLYLSKVEYKAMVNAHTLLYDYSTQTLFVWRKKKKKKSKKISIISIWRIFIYLHELEWKKRFTQFR